MTIQAKVANSKSVWDQIWDREGLTSWRRYPGVFGRIEWCIKHLPNTSPKRLLDVACGVGILIDKLHESTGVQAMGVDISDVAIQTLHSQGYEGSTLDLEDPNFELPTTTQSGSPLTIVTATEILEHLSDPQMHRLLSQLARYPHCFLSTPNNCLGPEVEPQHARKLTAKQLLDMLRSYRSDFRVECIDHYLLGVAGYPTRSKSFTLSFTMPVKNEAADIERVLKSFRGVADEIVIGVDDATTDDTKALALQYADVVFDFKWENNFSQARNACIDRCSGDWIFMSEGHEHLHTGVDPLLRLGPEDVPSYVDVIEVRREALNHSWYYPWLFRNKPSIRFQNAVHNQLTGYPDDRIARSEQISTWHERSLSKSLERHKQRKTMNKQDLLARVRSGDLTAMFYLANEYRDGKTVFEQRQSFKWYRCFIAAASPCGLRYQARMSLGRLCYEAAMMLSKRKHKDPNKAADAILEYLKEAKKVLAEATIDDPTRVEHWMLLGDLCESVGQLDFAMRFFEYAALGIGRIPSSYLFIDKSNYSYLPAQKLVNIYTTLELYDDALVWAKKLETLMPDHAPPEAFEEIRQNVAKIETLREGALSS